MKKSQRKPAEAGQAGQAEQAQDSKKQRKREADRLAQRQHRRRQKQHIQDLEAEIALLNQQPSHNQIVQLVEENKLLKEELASLRGVVGNIHCLLNALPSSQLTTPSLQKFTPYHGSHGGLAPTMPSFAAQDEFSTAEDAQSGLELDRVSSHPHVAATVGQTVSTGTVSTPSCPSTEFDPFIELPYLELDVLPAIEGHFALEEPFSAPFNLMRPLATGHLNHLSLPYHCDSSPEDQCIATLIQKVKCGEVVHSANTPSLMEYMLDSSHDSLVGRLKEYLEPLSRARKNSELLATYWVVYVMVLWQSYQTSECFKRLPHWLRPTECQTEMPHPMCIDFIPWPRLRDGIIHTYSGNWTQACPVLSALGEHMEFTFNRLLGDDLADSHSLQLAVGDIRNWKLREGFFQKYHQFQGLCAS